MIKKSRFIHWLRTWNHEWIPNSFYSPSYTGFVAGQKMIDKIVQGMQGANMPNITSFGQIEKIARSAFLLDENNYEDYS